MAKMRVNDIVYVLCRGFVICGDLIEGDVHLNDKILVDGVEFTVKGIEKMSFSQHIGLLLSPNKLVKDKIAKDIEIII